MTNHVHLLVTPATENGVSRLMQSVGRRYVRYFNQTYRRTGTLWEGRFKHSLVQNESYYLICSRYIELNPVRAGIVTLPEEYKCSSYHSNALGQPDSVIEPHYLYLALGKSTDEQQRNYRSLFQSHIDFRVLNRIRKATNKNQIIGDTKFMEEIEKILNRPVMAHKHGGDRKSETFKKIKQSV
jgi:putative transposase